MELHSRWTIIESIGNNHNISISLHIINPSPFHSSACMNPSTHSVFNSNSGSSRTDFYIRVCYLHRRTTFCHNPLKFRHRLLYLLLSGQIHHQQIQDILLENFLDDTLLALAPWPSGLSGSPWCSAASHSPLVLVLSLHCPAVLSSGAALLTSGCGIDITPCEQGDQRPAVSRMVGIAEARGESWSCS